MLADSLAFAKGGALAADEAFVVVADTAGYGCVRMRLTGDRAGATERSGSVLPGFPDNISTGENGNIGVVIASARDSTLDLELPRWPALRKVVWTVPQRFQPQPKSLIHIQAFAADDSLA